LEDLLSICLKKGKTPENENNRVCDLYMGVGTVGVVASTFGATFLGAENDPKCFEV